MKIIFGSHQRMNKIISVGIQNISDVGMLTDSCGDILPPISAEIEFCDEVNANSQHSCAGLPQMRNTYGCEVFCDEKKSVISFLCHCPASFCPSMYLVFNAAVTICEIFFCECYIALV